MNMRRKYKKSNIIKAKQTFTMNKKKVGIIKIMMVIRRIMEMKWRMKMVIKRKRKKRNMMVNNTMIVIKTKKMMKMRSMRRMR